MIAIASGVATPASRTPNVPDRVARTSGSAVATSATIASSWSATSSKSTVSSTVCDSVSWTIAIVATRRTASSSAARPSGGSIRRAWNTQQRGDGLQVVLGPVVDLADRRVLGDQLAFPSSNLGDVAAEDQGARMHAARIEQDRPQRHHGTGALDLGPPVCTPPTTTSSASSTGPARGANRAVTSPSRSPTRSAVSPSRR